MSKAVSIFIIAIFICFASLGQTKKDSLYVFVGKKIEVAGFKQKLDSNEIAFDAAFKAKYKIVQNLYGNYNKDTIEFEVYDHYGKPAFSQ